MPFGALKGFMPLNISELLKENDIQLARVLPTLAFTPSSSSLTGRLRRIYERSIFECAKLTKSIGGQGEVLHQLTENSAQISSQVGWQMEKPDTAPLTLALVSCTHAVPSTCPQLAHTDLIKLCKGTDKTGVLPQWIQDLCNHSCKGLS